jgi:hypothetical protein
LAVFGKKRRRRRAEAEADEFIHRLEEVSQQIDRRPLGRIDLRDVQAQSLDLSDQFAPGTFSR